ARILDVIAGYDPRDEMTVHALGRMPPQPYAESARAERLDGVRVGVLREYMDRALLSVADEQSLDLIERAIDDLRRLGAVIVDPGPGSELFAPCLGRYVPEMLNVAFTRQNRALFPVD